MNKINVHFLMDNDDVYQSITDRANRLNLNKTDNYIDLLKLGLINDELLTEIKKLITINVKSNYDIRYIKYMLSQIYSDLNLDRVDMNTSDKLKELNNDFRKKRFKEIE